MIIKMDSNIASSKTYTLHGVSKEELEDTFGPPNVRDDPYKVRWSWAFYADRIPCAVWDWKGSADDQEWSVYGPKEVWEYLIPGCVLT